MRMAAGGLHLQRFPLPVLHRAATLPRFSAPGDHGVPSTIPFPATAAQLMPRAALLLGLALLVAMATAAYLEWVSRVRAGVRLLRRSRVLRPLDDQEHAALATLRTLTGCRHDREVRALTGDFIPGQYSAGYPVCDGRLGGIPVLMPRQAWLHVAVHNEAEVVLGQHWAVVVRLNGFHVAAQRRNAASGRVCGERLETPAEVAMRRGPGLRFSALPIALLALWAAVHLYGPAGAYLAALLVLASAGLALWLALPRRNGPATARRVLTIRGTLYSHRHNAHAPPVWLLGADRRVQLPWEWANAHAFAQRRSMRLEVRADDGAVLGAGPQWCIARDRQHFPPSGAFWQLAWLGLLLPLLVIGGVWPTLPPWLPLALLMAVHHLVRLVVCIHQSTRCSAALAADIAQRPVPGL